MKIKAFSVCRYYTVTAHIRYVSPTKRRRRENRQQYAGPLRCRIHTPHLHPRYPPEARRGRADHGQLHGTGDVSKKDSKSTREKAKPSLWYSLNLSEHFRVWVTVWVRRLLHILPTLLSTFLQQKSTENRSFRCFLELLGGFEPPTSSLPRMRSTD